MISSLLHFVILWGGGARLSCPPPQNANDICLISVSLLLVGWRQDGIYHDRMHSLVVKQESLVLECSTELSYSYPPPSYLWLKDDDMLTEDENVLVTDTGDYANVSPIIY